MSIQLLAAWVHTLGAGATVVIGIAVARSMLREHDLRSAIEFGTAVIALGAIQALYAFIFFTS